MGQLKPSLFYLLYNHHLVSAERLQWALYYQSLGNWDWTPSFFQILLAFDDSLVIQVQALRNEHGPLDEEPLPQLLLDSGAIDSTQFSQIRALQRGFPQLYTGKLLIEQGLLDRDRLEQLLLKPYFQPANPLERPDLVYAALKQMERRLWMRHYLSRRDAENLQLLQRTPLTESFQPLADLLVLNGDLSREQYRLIRSAGAGPSPLENLLRSQGLVFADRRLDPAEPPGLQLVQQQLISRTRLSNLILNDCYAHLPEIRIQGRSQLTNPLSLRL